MKRYALCSIFVLLSLEDCTGMPPRRAEEGVVQAGPSMIVYAARRHARASFERQQHENRAKRVPFHRRSDPLNECAQRIALRCLAATQQFVQARPLSRSLLLIARSRRSVHVKY